MMCCSTNCIVFPSCCFYRYYYILFHLLPNGNDGLLSSPCLIASLTPGSVPHLSCNGCLAHPFKKKTDLITLIAIFLRHSSRWKDKVNLFSHGADRLRSEQQLPWFLCAG